MKISTDQFTYDVARRTLCAEISDLNGLNFRFEQVYPDSCDEGLTLVSAQSGREVDCVVSHVEESDERETLYWELRPTRHSLRVNPTAEGLKVILFND